MANTKITDLTDLTGARGDEIPVNRAGSDGKITAGEICTLAADPVSDDGDALGASGTAWSDLFLASGGVINFAASDVTLTHSSGSIAFSKAVTIAGSSNPLLTFTGNSFPQILVAQAGSSNGPTFANNSGNFAYIGPSLFQLGTGGTLDLNLRRAAAANLALGATDAAAPVAQTLSVQNVVAGTSDTAGAAFTIKGSQGTGTGAGGDIIFQTAIAGSTSSTQNALTTQFTISPIKNGGNNGGGIRVPTDAQRRVMIGFGSTSTYTGLSAQASTRLGVAVNSTDYLEWVSTAQQMASTLKLSWSSDADPESTQDLFLRRNAAANLALGNTDAAAPVAQTLSVQNVVAGTSDTAGAAFTIKGSQGTGTGAGGDIKLRYAPSGSTGSSQNAHTSTMDIVWGGISGNTASAALVGFKNITGFGASDLSLGTCQIGGYFSVGDNHNLTGNFLVEVVAQNVAVMNATLKLGWGSQAIGGGNASGLRTSLDTILIRRAAANIGLGAADAAAPVAQTLSVQNVVAGTSDTAGVDWTFKGSQGTGTGAGGSLLFQTAKASTTGSTQNALTTAITVNTTTVAVAAEYKLATTISATKTIASGVITVTGSYHRVETEGAGATDDLDTINGGVDGMRLVIRPLDAAHTVVVKDATGNIQCGGDFTMDNAQDTMELIFDSALSAWLEVGRSDNGA